MGAPMFLSIPYSASQHHRKGQKSKLAELCYGIPLDRVNVSSELRKVSLAIDPIPCYDQRDTLSLSHHLADDKI